MKARLKKLRYHVWLLLGGHKVIEGFVFLSQMIQSNRKLISELRSRITKLELCVWDLKGHTHKETLVKIKETMNQWTEITEVKTND